MVVGVTLAITVDAGLLRRTLMSRALLADARAGSRGGSPAQLMRLDRYPAALLARVNQRPVITGPLSGCC